jgi:Zn finger protein HypA/HybF involved in hydrogenase expression
MRKIREGKTLGTQMVDGKELPIIQPEIYERIYCKNCDNEVDSEEQAIGTCIQCNQPWLTNKAKDIHIKVLEMPIMGSDTGE